MVVVLCCRHRAHALADSQFLCTHTWNMCYWNRRRWCCPEYFIQWRPVASKAVALLFVVSLATETWLVKAHKKTAREVWRIIVVQYLEDWEIWVGNSERLSSDWKDRQLPEFCEKLWKASQCYSNQVLPGFDWKPGPEESSTGYWITHDC